MALEIDEKNIINLEQDLQNGGGFTLLAINIQPG